MISPITPPHPLRIGICAPYDLGRPGGVNSHIRAQARALRRLGHDVSIFGVSSAPSIDGEISLGGCVSLTIGGTETGFGLDPRSWRRLAKVFQGGRPFDVVHVHEPLMPLVPWLVLFQARAPVVATFHTHREEGHRWYARYGWLGTRFMRRVHVRLAVSDAARRTVARYFPGQYEIVPNGIDVERFQRPAARPREMPANRRSVLFVGRLEPRKGVDCLIRAMAAVQRLVPDVQLVVVGEGPERLRLDADARDARVAVAFAGRVPDEALPAYYQAADVVCSPALGGESFGIVLLEAMAAARPIVATEIAGYAELLDGSGCCRLVDAGSHSALAREITALVGDARLSRAMGERGAAFVRAFDWTAIARRLESIYARLPALAVRPSPSQ